MEEEEEEDEGRMDGWIKQNLTSDQFFLPVSGFLHVNVNVHKHELSLSGKQGWMDGWMDAAQHFAGTSTWLRASEPGRNSLLPSNTLSRNGTK